MSRLLTYMLALATSFTIGLTLSLSPASAQAQIQHAAGNSQAIAQENSHLVQYHSERGDYRPRHGWNQNRPHYRPHHRPHYRPYSGHHYRPYDRPYYRPYYQQQFRPLYRPAPPRYYRSGGNAHVNWCYNRYRSYRASDNTFQPNHGPRRQCASPFI